MAHTSKVVVCRSNAEAKHIHRQYLADVDPIVRELVEIELCSFPRYLLDTETKQLTIIDWYRPAGAEEMRLYLLAELQLVRERYGFSETDIAALYPDQC